MNIFNIQKYCLDDGPGIRTTVFIKGCPLRCQWCQNPEGQNEEIEIAFYKEKCIDCKECLKVCKNSAHVFNKNHIYTQEVCNYCMECVAGCPANALEKIGFSIKEKDLLEEILGDKIFYEFSGGGVTFSGGEPTYYIKELKKILVMCKKNAVSTAIETCGYFDFADFKNILEFLDLVMYDLKFFNSEKHIKYTGFSNERILSNLEKISEIFETIWIRIPAIPDINTGMDEIKNISKFIKSLKNIRRVEVLPFNKIGISKYKSLGKDYNFKDIADNNSYLNTLKLYKEFLGERIYISKF
jgi:pyruvate formate lyase activating enzyme